MNSKQFGKLIATLRKDQRDEHNQPYTQDKLAQVTQATRSVISNLERGAKVNLEPELLVNLANAFSLTSRERESFFLAAMRLGSAANHRDDCNAQETLETALAVLQNISIPAFVVDHYDNILAANHSIMALYEFSEQMRQNAPNVFAGYNVLRFVFSSVSPFSKVITQNKDPYLQQCISFFKAISLPYRATPYYERLMTAFNTDPEMRLFRSYYAQNTYTQDDFIFENNHALLHHPEFGELSFYSPPITPIHTSCGTIYLISYLPASAKTTECFGVLAKKHAGQFTRLEYFPVDEMHPDSDE